MWRNEVTGAVTIRPCDDTSEKGPVVIGDTFTLLRQEIAFQFVVVEVTVEDYAYLVWP